MADWSKKKGNGLHVSDWERSLLIEKGAAGKSTATRRPQHITKFLKTQSNSMTKMGGALQNSVIRTLKTTIE